MKALLLAGALALAFAPAAAAHSHHSSEYDLVSHNHYTNVSGHRVHGPSATFSGHRPPGATAHCEDGTWSFSEHHQGTCSHHGGVETWEN